jgi:hypothetical protein
LFAATVDNAGGVDEVTGMRKETRVRELNLKVAEPEVRYDPARLEQELFKQPATWLLRNVQLFFPLAGFFFSVLTDIQSGREVRNRQLRAEQLLKIISGLGPAIIKGNCVERSVYCTMLCLSCRCSFFIVCGELQYVIYSPYYVFAWAAQLCR